MNKKYHFAAKLITAIFVLGFMLGSSSDPPNGRTGAPGDGVCSSCHSGNNFAGDVTLAGLPATVTSGETYTLTVSVNNSDGNAVRAGFQMLSLFDDGLTNSGDYSTSTSDVGTTTASGKEYVEHRGAKNFASNVAAWTFDWEAPSITEDKAITMYAAGNIANGGGSSGDAIKFATFSTTVQAAQSALTASISIDQEPLCNGESTGVASVKADGGVEPYTYAWPTGGTMISESGIAAGNYTMTVTDADAATVEVDFVMTEPNPILVAANITDALCFSESNGLIDIVVTGGTGAYTYLWMDGATTEDLENIAAGTYAVTVTDENSCTATGTAVVLGFDEIKVNIAVTHESAENANDGTAEIEITGGQPDYTITWDGGVEPDVNNLAPGEYTVIVTDANGCSTMETFEIIASECNFTTELIATNITCHGANDGEASVEPSGFTQPISIQWSTGEEEFIFILGLAAGDYAVTLTDGAGCVKVEEFVIEEPDAVVVSPVLSIGDCTAPESNTLEATVTGGAAPYSFEWSNGADFATLNNVEEGDYVVTVTDANDCEAISSIAVSYDDMEAPNAIVVDSILLYLDETGMIALSAEDYDRGSTDNCGIQGVRFEDPIVNCDHVGESTIVFIAEDMEGNEDSVSVIITVLDTIAPTAICVENIVVNTCDSIFYEMPDIMDNCVVDSIVLAEGLPSGSVFPIGTTKVTYFFYDQSDNFGCCSFDVTVENDLAIAIDTIIDANDDTGGSISVTASGGSGNYSYEWTFNDTLVISNFEDVTNLDPGMYTVAVNDANGCFVVSESVLIDFASGIFDVVSSKNSSVFPNPAKDQLTIVSDREDIRKLEIFDLSGKLMHSEVRANLRSTAIGVHSLQHGMYFVKVVFDSGFEVHKFMKQ